MEILCRKGQEGQPQKAPKAQNRLDLVFRTGSELTTIDVAVSHSGPGWPVEGQRLRSSLRRLASNHRADINLGDGIVKRHNLSLVRVWNRQKSLS